ncbi:DUF5691 domain-containing protein [Kitasatospora viridis]|uniref:Uncharacterized protein n=1 Tax=Kitasatospora viridis TaxID=281105 RepID=A0A561UJK5_9ACTN|nr:DUF5691 domain-containing protein [Kitasatospora viridis]TWF99552.1 hypothetical protein FHX73_113399 [Kitasatospora viridis]
MNPHTDPWADLQRTALLGTDRLPHPGPAEPDPATALLERAALATVRRRAGLLPLPAPEPAPGPAADPDPRPPLPPAAARRLDLLLAGPVGGPASPAELLPQWLTEARQRGYRPPAALVPALLAAGRARTELRGDVAALAGPLGHWLAERNPDWRYLLRTAGADRPAGAEDPWQHGLFAERVTHLTRLRRRDPAAALALLESTWAGERAEDRLLFLDALQERLGPADEAFLEAALDDRSRGVRATAAELLSGLPGSALGARMAGRALTAVRLAPGRDRLLVSPPPAVTADLRRDGVAPNSPTGRGERAWRLGEVVAATPLASWTDGFGLTPAQLLALPVVGPGEGGEPWREELHEAWARAAVRQRDAGWARVLLGPAPHGGSRPLPRAGAPARLLAVLPAAERARWTAAFLRGHGLGDAFQLLGACAVPWTPPLSTAVVAALERAAASGSYPWSHSGVLGLTERSLAPATAPALAALAADAAPDSAWAETFDRLARTLRFRAEMLAELAG